MKTLAPVRMPDRLYEHILRVMSTTPEATWWDQLKPFVGAEARGYNERGDLITETTDGFPVNEMWDEFQKTIRLWNSWRSPMVNLLTAPVDNAIEGIRWPVENDFEEASEFGEPKGTRLGPAVKMAYDFKWWDLAIRYTWMFLSSASSDQLRALNSQALEADNRLMFTRVLRQIFNSTTRVATIAGDPYNVYPFYNGDTFVPPKWKTTTHTTGHQHYVTSGAATVDYGDLAALETLLKHHGYDIMSGYQLLLLVNAQEGATIRTMVAGAGSPVASYTFLASENVGGGVVLPVNGGIIGRPNTAGAAPGLMVTGTIGPWIVVEDDYIPAGYMVAIATQGEGNDGRGALGNPIGIRRPENPSLEGLRLAKGRDNDYPLIDSFYVHGFGTGTRHRGAGAVMQITAAGSYTIPTAYQ